MSRVVFLSKLYLPYCKNTKLTSTSPRQADQVQFELYELSPRNEDILKAESGTLSWTFPATAVQVPVATFGEDGFQDSLASFLEQASVESIKTFAEFAFKAGAEVCETRNTPSPSLITSFLSAVLEANGTRIAPCLLKKRVRDDVSWFDAEFPWRRSPLWLALRVAVARHIAMMLDNDSIQSRMQYKFFLAVVHSNLLDEIRIQNGEFDLEELDFLKAKISRRVFKLDRDYTQCPADSCSLYQHLMRILEPAFKRVVQETDSTIQALLGAEEDFRTKKILQLPRRAQEKDMILELWQSRRYLQDARHRYRQVRQSTRPRWHSAVSVALISNPFLVECCTLMDMEKGLLGSFNSKRGLDLEAQCVETHSMIVQYTERLERAYQSDTEQLSFGLLALMEAWVALDKTTCTLFPLLAEFHPHFPSRLLDTLQLPSIQDLRRARDISGYIRQRESNCNENRFSIFEDPCTGCFAEKFYDESPCAENMHQLMADIRAFGEKKRKEKEKEWQHLNHEHETLSRAINHASCMYSTTNDGRPVHISDCPKCKMEKKKDQMRIRIFEDPLPEKLHEAKSVVFELLCPRGFIAYRDATWMIHSRFATRTQETQHPPMITLSEYQRMGQFGKRAQMKSPSVSLASTSKSCKQSRALALSNASDLEE